MNLPKPIKAVSSVNSISELGRGAVKEESDITFVRIFESANRSWGIIRSDFHTPAPPMYIYKHHRICVDIYELVVTFVVT